MAFSEYMNFKYLQYYHRKATNCHQRKWAMHRTLGIYINLFFFSLMLFGFSVFPSLPPLTQIHSAQPRSVVFSQGHFHSQWGQFEVV